MHILAQVTGLKVGVFSHVFGDLHLYNNHKDQAAIQLSRASRHMPQLYLNLKKQESAARAIVAIEALTFEDFKLDNYNPHPAIKAPVAV